jgi:hypothetical protein
MARSQRSAQMISERKQRAAAAMWDPRNVDNSSWQKFTKCPFCGQRICVNNFRDHKVRLPRVDGVFMCLDCSKHGRGKALAAMYKLVVTRARMGSRGALAILRAMPVVPKEFRDMTT